MLGMGMLRRLHLPATAIGRQPRVVTTCCLLVGLALTSSAAAATTSTPTSSTVTMASATSERRTDQASQTQDSPSLSAGAKIGIAVAVALGVIAVFTIGLWLWWRRRQRLEVAKDMVNFVDGDIVNLMDGGRFEKRTKPPDAYYDPYIGGSSQSTISPSTYAPVPNNNHPTPPAEQQQYYASTPVQHIAPPPTQTGIMAPPPAVPNENAAWSNTGRHPWSPPDYEAGPPSSDWCAQSEGDFYTAPRRSHSSTNRRHLSVAHPVEALPAILPEMKPQAELPAREGYHGLGHEQELPAPQQAPPSRHPPPNGVEIEEQKFLLADMIPIRQQRSQPGGARPAG